MSALREVFAKFTTDFDAKSLEKGAKKTSILSGKLKALGATIVTALSVHAIRSFVAETVAIGDEIGKTSKVLGIGVTALQSWRYAAERSGVGAEAFNGGLTRIQRNMFDAQRGVETAALGFRNLGVDVADANGQLRPVEDVLRDMADPLKNMESATERNAILMTLMGRSGARLGPLFMEGADGVQALQDRFAELGGGLSPEVVQQSEDLADAWTDLDTATLGLKSKLATVLLPIFQQVAEALTSFVTNSTKVKAAILTLLVPAIAVLSVTAIPALIVKLQALTVAGALANAALFGGFILAAAGLLVLYLAVQDLMTALNGGDSVIGRTIDGMERWGDATRRQTGWMGALARMVDQLARGLENLGILADPDEITGQAADMLAQQGIDINTASGRRFARRFQREGTASPEAIADLQRDQAAEQNRTVESSALAGIGRGIANRSLVGSLGLAAHSAMQAPALNAGTAGAVAPRIVKQEVNVTVNGGDPREVTRAVRLAMDSQNREALAALTSELGDE